MVRTLSLSAIAAAVLLAAMFQNPPAGELLSLQWAAAEKSFATPGLAVMVELGAADTDATDWSGEFALSGARVLKQIPLGFRQQDKFTAENAWKAKSHPVPRWWSDAGARPVRTVGYVLHLAVEDDAATLNVTTKAGIAALKLADLDTRTEITALDGKVRFTHVSQTQELANEETEDDFPAACLGPDGALHVAYVSYTLSEPARREPAANLTEEPENFDVYALPTAGDKLWLRTRKDGKWSEPLAITAGRDDLCRVAVAADSDGAVWVGYSAQRNGNFDIHVRSYANGQLGKEETLTKHAEPDINPVMITQQSGRPAMAWQGYRDGKLRIFVSRMDKDKWWSNPQQVSDGDGNCWHPALASSPDGKLVVAWDQYRGDYDVMSSSLDGGQWTAPAPLAASRRFEARPSLIYDPTGRLWVAYEDGPEKWGKDYGALDQNDGRGLYHGHQVRVLAVTDGKVQALEAELPRAQPNDKNRRLDGPQYSHPQLGLDVQGNLWLTYRKAFGTRYHTAVGAYWMSFARKLLGPNWSEPVLLHRSDGLLDNRPVLLPNPADGVTAVFSGDSRYHNPDALGNNVFVAAVAPLGKSGAASFAPSKLNKPEGDDSEVADVAAIRAYRVKVDGKELQLLRGEFHRHTEISWDGRPDGSITDMYRYAIDAAAMDWIGNGDHDHGGGREYPWWITEKLNDALHSPGAFMPVFTYERSVSYPHGHRNAMFAQRGIRTLPRLTEKGKVSEEDTKMFYRYLKQFGGICASHSSATGMGTDWRDSNAEVEPIVEIYQGDRNSYEYAGAPRSGNEKTNLGGWRPKGFVNLALQKGVKLGFQSSSDHWSTHISYCVAMAEEASREGILNALKQRHCYGATDNIILGVTAADGKFTMGDSFVTRTPPQLTIYVRGTGPLARVDILRDSEIVETIPGKGNELKTSWTDPEPLARGEHYYYVRVLQKNEEIAWGSPLWIRFEQ